LHLISDRNSSYLHFTRNWHSSYLHFTRDWISFLLFVFSINFIKILFFLPHLLSLFLSSFARSITFPHSSSCTALGFVRITPIGASPLHFVFLYPQSQPLSRSCSSYYMILPLSTFVVFSSPFSFPFFYIWSRIITLHRCQFSDQKVLQQENSVCSPFKTTHLHFVPSLCSLLVLNTTSYCLTPTSFIIMSNRKLP